MNNTAIYVRVSTDEQRDSGYSIDSQIRMLTEYCEKNNYKIFKIYNDAGYSGKNLFRPEMQKLLNDIENKKINRIVALKTDRLTRSGYDGYWLLKYTEEHNVKIELMLEPFDVNTANGEMMFGMNLIFGQRERKEISARTKRGLEEILAQKKHPCIAPFGYKRNSDGYLEINEVEANVVREIYELYSKGISSRKIYSILEQNNRYIRRGKWSENKVYKILHDPIYIGTFRYRKTVKNEEIITVDNYCEPIIDKTLYLKSRTMIDKNKHNNYGKHIHLFSSIVKCPICHNIMSSTLSYKNYKGEQRKYYFLTCKNKECSGKGLHYNCDRLEKSLLKIFNELIVYMINNPKNILLPNKENTKELIDLDNALKQLRDKEKRLVDLYLESNLSVEVINKKQDSIKREIEIIETKKKTFKDYETTDYKVELLNNINDSNFENYLLNNKLPIYDRWDKLNKKTKQYIIQKFIKYIDIERDEDYYIDITNIEFNNEMFTNKDFINNILLSLKDNYTKLDFKSIIDIETILYLMQNNKIISFNEYLTNKTIHKEYKEVVNKLFDENKLEVFRLFLDNLFIDEFIVLPNKEL